MLILEILKDDRNLNNLNKKLNKTGFLLIPNCEYIDIQPVKVNYLKIYS